MTNQNRRKRQQMSPERLAAILRERIALYLPGTRLPTRSELADYYNVGEHIVRQAVTILDEQKLVDVRAKAGVFVTTSPPAERGIRRIVALVQTWPTHSQQLFQQLILLGADRRCSARQLQFEAVNDPADMTRPERLLELADGDPSLVGWMFVDLIPADHLMLAWNIQGIPTVLVDRYSPRMAANSVSLDFQRATYQGTEKLVMLGHRRVAYVGPLVGGPIITSRLDGYRMALSRHGLAIDERLMWDDGIGHPGETRRMIRQRLAEEPRPTAIMAANQRIGAEALQACDDLRLDVPEQVSVLACGAKMPDTPRPMLSRMSRFEEGSPESLGETAVDVLTDAHRSPHAVHLLLGSEWIDGGSAAPPPAGE